MSNEFFEEIKKQTALFGLCLPEHMILRLANYCEYLREMNAHLNLTAITEPKEVALKHIVDSLSGYDARYFFDGAKVLDLGSGAGFPGVPLAVVNPKVRFVLFDSLRKRLNFLSDVAKRESIVNVSTLHGRAEDMAHQPVHRSQYDMVTARGVARLRILVELSMSYVKIGGHFVSWKGAACEQELDEAERAIALLGGQVEDVKEVKLPGLEDKRYIVYIRKIKETPKRYPRKPKEVKEKSL